MTVAYFAARPIAQEQMGRTEADQQAHLRNIANVVNNTVKGLDNSSFQLTLDGTVTIVNDPRISIQSYLGLMPTSAAAAAALTSVWVSCNKGQATVNGGSTGLVYIACLRG